MNKQVIIEQCEKIESIVNEAALSEENARKDVEKYQSIKEKNTTLLSLLNDAKSIYQELERTLRIIEIDKEYDNTSDELENLKIRVNDLLGELKDKLSSLNEYDEVEDTKDFYLEFIKNAIKIVNGRKEEEKTIESDFSFDDSDDVLDVANLEKEEEPTLDDDTVDFSKLYKPSDDEPRPQKVIDVADFSDKVNINKEEEKDTTVSDTTSNDNGDSLSELNDLFNYLNDDTSFSA